MLFYYYYFYLFSFLFLKKGSKKLHKPISKKKASNLKLKKACVVCRSCVNASSILTCDRCEISFHKNCLKPIFTETPEGAWNCFSCIATILADLPNVYTKEFGFDNSYTKYTLEKFGVNANTFKEKYFKTKLENLSCADVEKEFWRIVDDPFDNIVHVEYGADLPAKTFGSGFPTKKHAKQFERVIF